MVVCTMISNMTHNYEKHSATLRTSNEIWSAAGGGGTIEKTTG